MIWGVVADVDMGELLDSSELTRLSWSSRRLAIGPKTASDLHRTWCAILGLNQ